MQLLFVVSIFVWIIVGYVWLISSWAFDPNALELRYKILFLGILVLFTMLYLPIICILTLVMIKVFMWIREQSKAYKMKVRLQNLGTKIYDSKFNFKEILPSLIYPFFTLVLNAKETKFLKENFGIIVDEENQTKLKETVCSICVDEYKKGDCVVTLPICGHEFHDICIDPWLEQQKSSCPNCRELVRVNMLKHYHGDFELPPEQSQDSQAPAESSNFVVNNANSQVELLIT